MAIIWLLAIAGALLLLFEDRGSPPSAVHDPLGYDAYHAMPGYLILLIVVCALLFVFSIGSR